MSKIVGGTGEELGDGIPGIQALGHCEVNIKSFKSDSKSHVYLPPGWFLLTIVVLLMVGAGLFLLVAAPHDVLAASGGVALTLIGVAAGVFQAIYMVTKHSS